MMRARKTLANWLITSSPADIQNWDELIETAANSGILQSLPTTSNLQVPEEIATLLPTVHSLNTDRNQTALAQVHQVTAALNQVGIQPVALKGLANILGGIYPDQGTRYIADIDLLIPQSHFPAALAVFRSLGYSASPAHPVEFNIGHTYPPFTRPDSLEIDLHRTLGLPPCTTFLPADELIRDATAYDASILIPSTTHLVTHHIIHSQLHDVYHERIAPSLRTLFDFYLLHNHLGSQLDWSAIESRFIQNGQYATLALYLLQVQETFHLDPPIPLRLTSSIRLRHRRRQILQDHPAIRLFDPSYYYFAGLKPRTRRLREILAQPQGLHYLLQKFTNPAFYARLKSDFRA